VDFYFVFYNIYLTFDLELFAYRFDKRIAYSMKTDGQILMQFHVMMYLT